MSNSLDPDQDRQFVSPDLGPNCLQRLSADNKSRLLIIVITTIMEINLLLKVPGSHWISIGVPDGQYRPKLHSAGLGTTSEISQ